MAPNTEILKTELHGSTQGLTQGLTQGSTLVATINRPAQLNALNAAVIKDLAGLLEWLESPNASSVRAVVITGAGEKAFVAGADITEFQTMNAAKACDFSHAGLDLFARFEKLRVPVIAAVNGFALGGGLELALSADFIYAAENAKFGLPECTLGIMPGYGGTVRLPRRVGPALAMELAMSGQLIAADEALRMGLVNRVVSKAELLKTALETAAVLASRAPLAVAAIKKSIQVGRSHSVSEASKLEASLFGELFGTQDQKEGVSAFLEKRKANFVGK